MTCVDYTINPFGPSAGRVFIEIRIACIIIIYTRRRALSTFSRPVQLLALRLKGYECRLSLQIGIVQACASAFPSPSSHNHRFFTRANFPSFSSWTLQIFIVGNILDRYFPVDFATINIARREQHGAMVASKTARQAGNQTRWNQKSVRYTVPADLSFPKAKHWWRHQTIAIATKNSPAMASLLLWASNLGILMVFSTTPR